MTPLTIWAALLGLASLGWLTRPLWEKRSAARADSLEAHAGRPARRLHGIAVAIGVAMLGFGGYIATRATGTGPADRPSAAQVDADAVRDHAIARVQATVARLTEQLHDHPDDAQAWQTLARSEAALGHSARATEAFENALARQPDDPGLLADFALALAAAHPAEVNGKPRALVERALALDPRQTKALALAGTLALTRRDYATAIRDWDLLATIVPATSPMSGPLRVSLQEARKLQGEQRLAAASAIPAASAPGRVGGLLELKPALRAQVSPEDTVFVYARASKDGGMPLAVLRKQVKDLPLRFSLDDRQALSADAKLSQAATIWVGASVSHSGQAQAQAGDLRAPPVTATPGRQDLRLELSELVPAR